MLTPLLLLAGTALAIPPGLGAWDVLQPTPVWVGCTQVQGSPWCRSVGVVPAPPAEVAALLADFPNYPSIFERVTSARVLAPDVVHITLDMPFPIASRDYVARFSRRQEGTALVFDFDSVVHPAAPTREDPVRLPRAGGQWRLEPEGPSSTRVTYTWNGELGGDFPSWALPRAWTTQGTEVMDWLSAAAAR